MCCRGGVADDQFSTLGDAAYSGHQEKVAEVLSKNANVNEIDSEGFSPIHRAAQGGNAPVISTLLSKGANPSLVNAKTGETVLHLAAFHRNVAVMKALLATDAKTVIDTQDKNFGMTPLHIAVKRGSPEITELLLENGANPDLTDANGQTVLEMGQFYKVQEQNGLSSPTAKHLATLQVIEKRVRTPSS